MTSSGVRVQVPKLQRLLAPHELREATIRDYKAAAERAGVRVDLRTLERMAVADCEMAERYQRDRVAAPAVKRDPKERRAKIERELAGQGVTMVEPTDTVRQPLAAMHGKLQSGDRWEFALGRVARIMAGANQNANRVIAYSTCELPHLAYAIFRIYADLTVRKAWRPRPGDEPNDFFGLSDVDANRLLQRKIEDVCDLSTGRLGAWRTPR